MLRATILGAYVCHNGNWGEPERSPFCMCKGLQAAEARPPLPEHESNLELWHANPSHGVNRKGLRGRHAGCVCPPSVPENTPIHSINKHITHMHNNRRQRPLLHNEHEKPASSAAFKNQKAWVTLGTSI